VLLGVFEQLVDLRRCRARWARPTCDYREFGHRDSKHLRRHTRRDLVMIVADAGWQCGGTEPATFCGRDRHTDRVMSGARELGTL
jgi:hypothetical protein